MKTRLLIPTVLLIALAAPIAISSATAPQSGPTSNKAQIAKKKLSYCQKKAKSAKAKLVSKVSAAKFSLYKVSRPSEYFFCSESPKYIGSIAEWRSGIKTTSHLRAVKNNCAVFYHASKAGGTSYDADTKYLKYIQAKYFRKSSRYPKQTNASILGQKGEAVSVQAVSLSKNCVAAVGYTVNGQPKLKVLGMGDFPEPQWIYTYDLTGSSAAALKSLKVSGSGGSATVTWGGGSKPYPDPNYRG